MSRLKELLWGTPEEIKGDRRYAQLKRRPKLTAKQRVDLDEANGLSKRLFLRRAVTTVGGAIVLTSPIAAYVTSGLNRGEQAESKYDGPINAFKGLEYVPRNSILKMTETLENSGHPILGKIAKGVRILHNAQTRPQEFPEWIDERSFPFAVVQDNSNHFTTEFQVSKPSQASVKFVIPSVGATEPQEGIDKMLVGIKLGLRDTPLSGDLFQPALLLAKEYLTLLHLVAFNEEFYDITKSLHPGVLILDPSGREITDRSKQKAVGRRLLLNNLSEKSSAYWKVADGFSMLTLGTVLRDLVASGKIKNYGKIRSIVLAANLVTNSSVELQRDLFGFMESWRLKDGFIFPAGTAAKTFDEPYFSTVISLENQIDQAEKGDKQ